MGRTERRLVLSCEHGGASVPRAWRELFAGREALLASHRALDAGALPLARGLSRALEAPLVAATTTRLLVDLNRSAHNPAVFSELTRGLPRATRDLLIERHHRPHRARVREAIESADRPVLHLAVHSFTPVRRGVRRRFALGILYDPARARERAFAIAWQARLRARLPRSGVRRNAPYRGSADGLTTALRRELSAARYLGIELEVNQRAIATPVRRRRLVRVLADTLRELGATRC